MTKSEDQFRIWYKKLCPHGFIQKIPDFKATGSKAGAGLPDYITIDAHTVWYEVKKINGYTLSLDHFTDAQRRVFPKMVASGANILIWVKLKKGFFIVPWNVVYINKTFKIVTK